MTSQYTSSQRNTSTRWQDQNEPVTNFCASIDCLLPLTPDDIHNHYEFHTQIRIPAQIQSIKNTRIICAKKLTTAIAELSKGIDDGDIQYILNPEELFHQEVKKMEQCRDTMIDIIRIFIETQKKKLKSSIDLNLLKVKDIGGVFTEIKEVIAQLEGLRNNLDNSDPFPSISKACRLDVKSMLDRYKSQVKKVITTRQLDPITVHIDEQKLFQLNLHLNRIIHVITHQEREEDKSEISLKDVSHVLPDQSQNFSQIQGGNDNVSQSSGQSQRLQPKRVQNSTHQVQPSHVPHSTGQFQQENPDQSTVDNLFKISQPDFFEKTSQKFLHFFKNDDNLLYYLDLTQFQISPKFKQIRLNQEIRIPFFHRSIATPKGAIYLSGGTESQDQKNSIIYCFNFQNNKLEGVANMQIARSSHTMVYCQNQIYFISGFVHGSQLTPSVERFNILTNTVQKVADCIQPSNASACCTFQNKYIYKFGVNLPPEGSLVQIIERYDISKNIWEHIDPKLDQNELNHFDQICQYAASTQINEKNILVFGGYDFENQSSTFSFLLTEDGIENTINGTNLKPLPYPEGFWNNQCITQNNQVYVLQNIDVEGDIDESKRIILSFDGQKWTDHGQGL